MEDWKEEKHWAEYSFSLEGPSKDYTLHVSHFAGDLPDVMTNLTGSRFSTKDKNNDSGCSSDCTTRNCTGAVSLMTETVEISCRVCVDTSVVSCICRRLVAECVQ